MAFLLTSCSNASLALSTSWASDSAGLFSSFLTKPFSASTRLSFALLTSSACASFESSTPSAVFSALSFTLAESSVYWDLSSSLCLLSSSLNCSLAVSTSLFDSVFSTKSFSAWDKLSSASWTWALLASLLVKTWFTFFSALLKFSALSEVYFVVSKWLSLSAFSFKAFFAARTSWVSLFSFGVSSCWVVFSGDTCFSLRDFVALTIESIASWTSVEFASLLAKTTLASSRALVTFSTESSVYLSLSNFSPALTVSSNFSLSAFTCESLSSTLSLSLFWSTGFSTKFLIASSSCSLACFNSWRVAFLSFNALLASWRAWANFLADSCVYLPVFPKARAWSSSFLKSFLACATLLSTVLSSFPIVLTSYSTTSDSLPYLSTVLNRSLPLFLTVTPSSGRTLYLFPLSVLYKTLPSLAFPVTVTDFLSDAVVAVICGEANFWAFL